MAGRRNSSSSQMKKKKEVVEIDGSLWLLDDMGNPLKKVRKKGGVEASSSTPKEGRPPPSSQPHHRNSPGKKKKNVAEIDGQLYLLDEAGNPLKKIRKKGGGGGEGNARPPQSKPSNPRKEYIDEKGRKVLIEADGSKTVFGKDGKRLRPKKKKVDDHQPTTQKITTSSVHSQDSKDSLFDDTPVGGGGGGCDGGEGLFDELWDDIPGDSRHSTTHAAPISLSEKIDEVGKQNQELAVKLQTAEEEIEDLLEENKKEKAKSVKAVSQMMQAKAEITEASTELDQLRQLVASLKGQMSRKDEEMGNLRNIREKTAELERSMEQLNFQDDEDLICDGTSTTEEDQDDGVVDQSDDDSIDIMNPADEPKFDRATDRIMRRAIKSNANVNAIENKLNNSFAKLYSKRGKSKLTAK